MEQIQALVRKFPKLSTVAVVLLLVLSSLMILTAPFKVQVAGVRDLVEPHIAETLDSLELEKIDDALLKEDLISAEGMDYIEEQLVNAFLSLLPGSVEVEVSLADIEYLCAQYADTRSFVESSAVTTDVIQQAILNIVLENAFVSNALETEEQIFKVINTYRAAYYVLVLLSLISIALVCFRRKIAVLVWMVPAALISLGLAVLSTVGDAYIANHIYEQMYLRFPAGMFAGLVLACVAFVLYRMVWKAKVEKGEQVAEGEQAAEQEAKELEAEKIPAVEPQLEQEAMLPEPEPVAEEPEAVLEELPAEESEPEPVATETEAQPTQELAPAVELEPKPKKASKRAKIKKLRKENELLKEENARLREENELLRKAADAGDSSVC